MARAISSKVKLTISFFTLFCLSLFLTAYTTKNRAVGRAGASLLSDVTAPVHFLNDKLSSSLGGVWGDYIAVIGAKQENEELRKRLSRVEALNSGLLEFQSENRRLRRLLKMKEEAGLEGITARVIGYNPSIYTEGITINRGKDDGVKLYMPVIEGRGVVGQIVSVGKSTANVLLLTDRTSGVDALVQGSRVTGIVGGLGQEKCVLRFILTGEAVKVGERVLTSGMDGIYPKGLLVGRVSGTKREASGMFKAVEVQPAVHVSKLEEVLVITTHVVPGRDTSDESEITGGEEH